MTLSLQSFDRWKAAGLHLALSALIALTVVLLLLAVWYPQPYFQAMGGEKLLRLLIGVDVVLGPLITLIIFDPRKPALKWDLAAIAALQVTALAYGGVVMFQARRADGSRVARVNGPRRSSAELRWEDRARH
jgi:hypothetical protein